MVPKPQLLDIQLKSKRRENLIAGLVFCGRVLFCLIGELCKDAVVGDGPLDVK